MKVKVIKASGPLYWYKDKIGQEFEVAPFVPDKQYGYRLVSNEQHGSYFNKDDVEIIKENVHMFDLKKDKWFIRTPTPEISKAVQEWLFEQGLVWQHFKDKEIHCTESLFLKLSPFEDDAFCYVSSIDPKYDNSKEVKLTFKTIVDSVEYPETITPEQQQLAQVMQKLDQLRSEAEQLQAIINKGKV